MLPPNGPGTIVLRTSPIAGATPRQPRNGASGTSHVCRRRRDDARARRARRHRGRTATSSRQVGAEHRRAIGADEGAEARTERRHRVVARRLELQKVHGDRVAGLGALDVERTRLRIVVPRRHHLRRQIARRLHGAVEAVFGPRHDARAGRDAMLRRGAAERVDEIVVLGRPAQRRRRGGNFTQERRRLRCDRAARAGGRCGGGRRRVAAARLTRGCETREADWNLRQKRSSSMHRTAHVLPPKAQSPQRIGLLGVLCDLRG